MAALGGLAALLSLLGCWGVECASVAYGNAGNFQVTLSVAQGPLPGDLTVTLTGDGSELVLTLGQIEDDTSNKPPCWFGTLEDNPWLNPHPDAGSADGGRLSCAWGYGAAGVFAASAAGYETVSVPLMATKPECECSCGWIAGVAEIELEPL